MGKSNPSIDMADQTPVQYIPCVSADDFLEAISPRSTYLKGAFDRHPSFFIYRGHADDTWELIPKALRLGQTIRGDGWGIVKRTSDGQDNFFYENGIQKVGAWGFEEQVHAEWRMLGSFFDLADLNGLPLPEDSQQLRQLLKRSLVLDEKKIEGWPRSEFLSLLGLGQHYGLPTRLLDWTRSSFIAAYFAAEEAARKQYEGGKNFDATHLSVWAFNEFKRDLYWRYRDGQLPMIEIVTAPAAGNPNLHAQKGLFTLVRSDCATGIDRRPIDKIMSSLPIGSYELFHFTLPITEAPALLGLLSNYEITGATVYPGYGGAAKALFEERFF